MNVMTLHLEDLGYQFILLSEYGLRSDLFTVSSSELIEEKDGLCLEAF